MTRASAGPLLLLVALVLTGAACGPEAEEKKEVKWLPVERAPQAPVPPADAAPMRPAGVEAEQVEAAEAVEAWFKTLAAAARGSASDCIAMARAIESVGAKGRPIVARVKQLQKRAKDPAVAEWLGNYLREQMDAGYNELVAAMGMCAENPTVKKAMKAIAR